jgi:hypothetical protein
MAAVEQPEGFLSPPTTLTAGGSEELQPMTCPKGCEHPTAAMLMAERDRAIADAAAVPRVKWDDERLAAFRQRLTAVVAQRSPRSSVSYGADLNHLEVPPLGQVAGRPQIVRTFPVPPQNPNGSGA